MKRRKKLPFSFKQRAGFAEGHGIMDITQLRYFLKTAELLNYTKAAESLFITRQSLRQAISVMEKELGIALFENERNKLSLTEYGEYLYLTGTDVVKAFDSMLENMERLAKRQITLRVAFSVSLFPFMLPDTEVILRAFRSHFPNIRLEIFQWANDEVIRAVQSGQIDCGCVIQMPCERPGCTMQVLKKYPAVVDYGRSCILRGRREIGVEDLAGVPCISMGSLELTMHPVWEECRRKGICLDYEIVPGTIDAFYKIQNNLAVGFDILKTEVPEFDWNRVGILRGHFWEIGFLCHAACAEKQTLELFCSFYGKEYAKRWANYLKEWNYEKPS